jgi:predicted Zn-dependent protease
MRKVIWQAILLVTMFFATWVVLSKVNWMNIFKVEQVTKNLEERLGELFWDVFSKSDEELDLPDVTNILDSLLTRICISNHIDKDQLKIHVLKKDEINAFTLPDRHLVIFSRLILNAENEEELCGVICHELAHMELDHVMKRLVKEVGLSVLVSMTTGSGGSDAITEAARLLSSTAYDRSMEREADIRAIDYLINSEIKPEPFADFLFRLGSNEPDILKQLSWINTHPDTKERAEYILEYCKEKTTMSRRVLSEDSWNTLKEILRD